MGTIEVAYVSHGRTDDRHDWKVYVDEVSLWRLVTSRFLMDALHKTGLCCSQLVWWGPFSLIGKVGYRLLNASARIDNGWLNQRYIFKVDDAWVKEHAADFWADMHDLYAEEDEGIPSIPWEQVKAEAGLNDEAGSS